MFIVHGGKKLLERVKPTNASTLGTPSKVLGGWYPTALFWKPQIALLVHEETMLPVLMPLAPASSLAERFPADPAAVLKTLDVDAGFIAAQVAAMSKVQ